MQWHTIHFWAHLVVMCSLEQEGGMAVLREQILSSKKERGCSVVTGRDREVCGATHNWPSVARVREGLASREILVSLRTSDSCGGRGTARANQQPLLTITTSSQPVGG